MICKSCVLACPAVAEATQQVAGLDEQLAAIARREDGRRSDAIQWEADEQQAIDDGTWTARTRERHNGFRNYLTTASQTDAESKKHATAAKEELGAQIEERQANCTKGPRFGLLGLGVGATVCRSTVKDDGLPNKR